MLSLNKFFGVRYANVVSTGSLKLDIALGTGGLPKVIDN
jgi:recombination protein RecA